MDNEFNLLLVAGGLIIGLLFGALTQRSRYCMAAVVSNLVLIGDRRQLHAWLVTILIAVSGVYFLESGGVVAIDQSAYRQASISVVGGLLGGLIFGIGAIFAGGCIGRILTLTGEGNLGALLALLTLAFGATASYVGFIEPTRLWLDRSLSFEATSGDAAVSSLLQLPLWLPATLVVGLIATYLYRKRGYGNSPQLLFAGATVGLLVVAGWLVTGHIATDEFNDTAPRSLGFAGPVASSTLLLGIGSQPASLFGICMVSGTVLGSFLSAVINKSFRLTPPDPASIARILAGGFMMGVGAICAGGCNIGQGVSGLSTLSFESMIAVAAIFSGMFIGVKWLQFAEQHGALWKLPQFLQLRQQESDNQQLV